MNNDTTAARKKLLTMMGVGIVIIAIGLAAYLLARGNTIPTSPEESTAEEASDDSSYATNQKDLAQTPGSDFTALTAKGATADDLDALQYALYSYAQPKSISVKNARVIDGTVTHTSPDINSGDVYQTYIFNVRLDSSHQISVRLKTDQLYSALVTVFDSKTKATLYDSGNIDTRNL